MTNFADQRKAAAGRLKSNPTPKSKDYAYPQDKPNVMGGSNGADVTEISSNGNHQNLVNKSVYTNKTGRGGTSKNY